MFRLLLGLNYMAFNTGYYLLSFDLAKIYASELTICHLLCHLQKVSMYKNMNEYLPLYKLVLRNEKEAF